MKKILLLVMALCSVIGAKATEISESEAARIASEFVTSHGFGATRGDAKLTLAKSSQGYYAYNRGAGAGFVVVAADDAMGAQVLGYSASGSLDFDKLPCNLKWWLAQYDLMAATGASFPQTTATRADAKADVEPLVTCQWNQDSPYNDLCPEIGDGVHCATGCAATALAQVMYYHQWPKQGAGSNSYEWNDQTLSMDFSQSTYDWAHMTDTYGKNSTDEENNAVAELMRDCGYAMNMLYGEESAAYPYDQPNALVKYFGYDHGIRFLMRQCYTYDEWNDMFYNELAAKRPILAGGGGHAFVMDGYKQVDGNDWYHVNWGWGGLSDGYFLCSSLNPNALGIGAASGSYNQGLTATLGIKPAEEGSETVPEIYSDPFMPVTAKKGGDVTFPTEIMNCSVVDTVFTFGLKVISESTQKTTYVKNDTASTIKFIGGFVGLKMSLKDFPTDEGTYNVYPIYNVGDKEYDVRIFKRLPTFSKAVVKGDSISFTYGENFGYPNMSEIKVNKGYNLFETCSFGVTAVATAKDKEFCGTIYAKLVNDPMSIDSIYSTSEAVAIDLRKGESVNTTFTVSAPGIAGSYYLIFVNENGMPFSYVPNPITVYALPEGELELESNIKLGKTKEYDMMNEALGISASLKCTSGYYQGYIYLALTEQGQENPSAGAIVGETTIVAGGAPFEFSGTVIAGGTLASQLEYGKTYTVALGYFVSDEEVIILPSDVTLTTIESSGINDVNASGEPQTIKIYSLGGKLVTTQKATTPNLSTLPAGAYIVKIGDKVQKMVSGK